MSKVRAELLIEKRHGQTQEQAKLFRDALHTLGDQFDFQIVFLDLDFYDKDFGRCKSDFLAQERNDATG